MAASVRRPVSSGVSNGSGAHRHHSEQYYSKRLYENTDIECAATHEAIEFAEECFLLRIVQCQSSMNEFQVYDVLDDHGDYRYDPMFFTFSAWEGIVEELEELHDDVPGIEDTLHESHGVTQCDICSSDIRAWEVMGYSYIGEIHSSERQPNKERSVIFNSFHSHKKLCIGCLYYLESEHLSSPDVRLWPVDIEPVPDVDWVCVEGIYSRCWRRQTCPCRAGKIIGPFGS